MNYRRNLLAVGLVLLVVVTASGCTFISQLKARDQLNKGVSAYNLKDYDNAAQMFSKAIELDPSLTTARLYLAQTYAVQFVPQLPSPENMKKGETAIGYYEEVLKHDPKNVNAMASIANIYVGMDENGKAKDWQRKRLEVDPTNPEPLYGIGTIDWKLSYAKTGQTGENAANLTDEERAEVNGLVDEGIDALKKAMELRPEYTDAMQYLNLLYREKAKLTTDEAQKNEWLREADRLALQALKLQRQHEEEQEKARRMLKKAPTEG